MSNNKDSKKKKANGSKDCSKLPMPYEDLQSLQVAFYEINSWIEKSKSLLRKTTAELEKASQHLQVKPKPDPTIAIEQLLDQHPLLDSSSINDMKWVLSFQPDNLLRIDTNITSVEQLIEAVHKIRRLQQGKECMQEDVQEQSLELYSSPCTPSTSSTASSSYYQAAEYWLNASLKNPHFAIDDYKHCCMNLDNLLKSMIPNPLQCILQISWNCLHPKFASDWDSFWNRSTDPKLNRLCTDSALSRVFLHIMRHDRALCPNAPDLAGYYYDRAREELMEYFDAPASCALIEAIINLSMSCLICKRYSKTQIYLDLGYRKWLELGASRSQYRMDIMMRKRYLKLGLALRYNDYLNNYDSGEPCIIDDSDHNVDYNEINVLNDKILKGIKCKQDIMRFEQTRIREAYYVYHVELIKIGKQTTKLALCGASEKVLLARERSLIDWYKRLPDNFVNHVESPSSAYASIERQASLLLKMEYERQWINIHKHIFKNININDDIHSQRAKSKMQCIKSAVAIVELAELYNEQFEWCVFQFFLTCIYQASTVFCMIALEKTGEQAQCKSMILRVMRILGVASRKYEGMPDGMARCLCEFLKNQSLHDDLECACNTYLKLKPNPIQEEKEEQKEQEQAQVQSLLQQDLLPDPQTTLANDEELKALGFDSELKELKQMLSTDN